MGLNGAADDITSCTSLPALMWVFLGCCQVVGQGYMDGGIGVGTLLLTLLTQLL